MKNIILKSIFALVMTFMTMPMMGQDFMNVYFKDGTYRKFYLKNVTEITVSKLDANGVGHSGYEYQRITCSQNDYVYSLQDVDSVTLTKYDEEKVKENFEHVCERCHRLQNGSRTSFIFFRQLLWNR